MNSPKNIPLNDVYRSTGPDLLKELCDASQKVIQRGWYVLGTEVKDFEREFAHYNGSLCCVGVANGTDALELGLKALGVGHGGHVATVANAGMYSTTSILACGAHPIFVDVDPKNLLMDPACLQELLLQRRPDAIIVTHLYGRMADIEQINGLRREQQIPLIEDCAQCHGAVRNGRKAGTFGEIGCFSFYPTKNLGGLGDGGAIITDRADLAEKIRSLRQYGWSHKYNSIRPGGRNSRLDEIQAAALRIKLPYLDQWNEQRRRISKAYSERIDSPKVLCPPLYGNDYVAHLYVIRTKEREALVRHLRHQGIMTDIHYPLADYHQPSCRTLFPGVTKPVTEAACAEVISLPCFPGMTEHEIAFVIAAVNNW